MEAGFPSELCSHDLRYSRLWDVSMRSGESWLLSFADLSAVWAGEDTKVFLGLIQGKNVPAVLDSLCLNPRSTRLLAWNNLLILSFFFF